MVQYSQVGISGVFFLVNSFFPVSALSSREKISPLTSSLFQVGFLLWCAVAVA